MAQFKAAKYEKATPAEKPNPFVEVVKPFTDQGVDTAFTVTFEADDYKAEKLLIQKAVNVHGFSAREVESDWNDDEPQTGKTPVHSTFLIRPARKRKADAAESAEATPAE